MAKDKRFLGDLDAATDRQFENHFVESADLTRLLTSDSDIVLGSKGVGKTALRRALTEINRDHFFAAKTVDLESISFSQVHTALNELRHTSNAEVPSLARNTWRNVLAIYALEAMAESLAESHPLKRRIHSVLDREQLSAGDPHDRIMQFIDRLLIRVADAGADDTGSTPLGLNRQQRDLFKAFPALEDVGPLLEKCCEHVRPSGKSIVVCLDGFDSIVDHTPESRQAIFAGLIDAVHKCSKDSRFSGTFCFKAFLPQELAHDADAIVWDADKFMQHTHHLRWSEADFQTLLKKRLQPYAKTRSASFLDVWHEFMPDKVRNEVHKVDEPSFNYIIRHTLYRPRQILMHVQEILDRWDHQSDSFRVDPSFIPPVVASVNQRMAQGVSNQLAVKYPHIIRFLKSWHGMPNVVPIGEFRDRLKKFMEIDEPEELSALFTELYNFGVFGVSVKNKLSKGGAYSTFRFGSVGDRFDQYTAVDDGDLIGISPMFHEFCHCIPSEYGAILPVSE